MTHNARADCGYLRGEAGQGAVWLYRRRPDGSDELVARTRGVGR